MNTAGYIPTFHRVALVTCGATLLLIGMGGLVTSHSAGMSVPDWPNSYGYNMFLFPPQLWIGGIRYEHIHRLMGTVVGFLSIELTLRAWAPARNAWVRRWIGMGILGALGLLVATLFWDLLRHAAIARHIEVGFGGLALVLLIAYIARQRESRRWIRWLAIGILGMVIVQGVLGGQRVVRINVYLAMVHACFAQACLCTMAAMAVATSRSWLEAPDLSRTPHAPAGRALVAMACGTFLLIYLQLIVGACMRHSGAGLAIPDVPLAYGKILPPMNASELAAANHERAWEVVKPGRAPLAPVTLGQIWIHFAHRIGAILVTAAIVALIVKAWQRRREHAMLATPAVALIVLLAVQLTLGVLTVILRKPADVASAHVAVGALTLMTTAVLSLRTARAYSSAFRAQPVARGFDPAPSQHQTASVYASDAAEQAVA